MWTHFPGTCTVQSTNIKITLPNPFYTGSPFWGDMQTVQTQIRRRNWRRLIRVCTVSLQEFLCIIIKSENIHQESLKMETDSSK